jgi:dTDP-4-dehydrorhamnose 3,5-epimerase
MKFEKLDIEGAWVVISDVYSDDRGSFREWFKFDEFKEATQGAFQVKQSNLSVNNKGVLRGIHYSLADVGQAKWVTCAFGHILDFLVDIRPDSQTYMKYLSVDLRAGDGRAVLIGAGLGHAFLSLEDGSVVSYLLDSPYSPSEEFEINPMDPELGIDWQLGLVGGMSVIMSPKDAQAPTLAEQLAQGKLPRLK